jgi:hypothetical protein
MLLRSKSGGQNRRLPPVRPHLGHFRLSAWNAVSLFLPARTCIREKTVGHHDFDFAMLH